MPIILDALDASKVSCRNGHNMINKLLLSPYQ